VSVRILVSFEMTPEEWKEYDKTHPNPSKAEIAKILKELEREEKKRKNG